MSSFMEIQSDSQTLNQSSSLISDKNNDQIVLKENAAEHISDQSILNVDQPNDQIAYTDKVIGAGQITDQEITPAKRSNTVEKVSLETVNTLTPKIFMANIKYMVTRKFSNLIANVPRSIVYSRTYGNLKTIIQTKLSSSSSSNNIDKLKIMESNSMDLSIESDHSVKQERKLTKKENVKIYAFNDEMLLKHMNFVNTDNPQYCLKPNIIPVTNSSTANLQDEQSGNKDSCEHELNLIKQLNANDMKDLCCLSNNNCGLKDKNASSINQACSEKLRVQRCKNFDICKGKGNTNRYKDLKTHRKAEYCPFESKEYTSISDELVEVQSKDCQTSFQDNRLQVEFNASHQNSLDHGVARNSEFDQKNDENASIVSSATFSSYNISLNRQDESNSEILSTTVLAKTTLCDKTNATRKNVNNDQNLPTNNMENDIEKPIANDKDASNFPMNIDQCSNLLTDVAESNDENSITSNISNQTDDSQIKLIYEKSGIRRTKSINFSRKNLNLKKKNPEHKKIIESTYNLYQELQRNYVKLQKENDQAELEISKLKGIIDQKNKKSCPTRGCYGQGNVNNENFEGHHNVLSSCPLAFIQNQNNELINNLRTELLKVTTELKVDMPRYVQQIDFLKKTNSELELKLEQMSSLFEQKKVQLLDASTEINKELLEQNMEVLNTELELKTDAFKKSCKQMEDENNDLKNKLNQSEQKYQAMISHNSIILSNLEKNSERFEKEMDIKLDTLIFEQNLQKEKNINLNNTNKILNDQILKQKENFDQLIIEKEETIHKLKIKLKESNAKLELLNVKLNESKLSNDNLNNKLDNIMAQNTCLDDQIKTLKIINSNLESQLKEKNSVIENNKEDSSKECLELNIKINSLSDQLKKSCDKISQLEIELLESRQEKVSLKSQLNDSSSSVEIIKKDLNKSNEIVNSLKNSLDKSNKMINDLTCELKEFQEKERNLFNELELAKLSVDNLNHQITDFNEKEKCLNDQINNFKKMINSLSNKQKFAFDHCQETESKENIKLQVNLTEINAKLISSNSKITVLENELKTQQLSTNNLRKELEETKSYVITLKKELSESKDNMANLNNRLELSNSNISDLTSQLNQSIAKEKCLNDQINDLKTTISSLESQLIMKNSVIESQKEISSKELLQLNIKIKNISDKLNKSNHKTSKLEKELLEAKEEINSFKSKLDESNSSVEDLKKNLTESKETNSNLNNQIKDFIAKERGLINEQKLEKQCVNNLNRQLTDSINKQKVLNDQINELKSLISCLESQLKEKISVIESNKETLSKQSLQLNSKISSLSSELKNSNDKTSKLEKELQEAIEEINNFKSKLNVSNTCVETLKKDLNESRDMMTSKNNQIDQLNGLKLENDDLSEKIKSLNFDQIIKNNKIDNLNKNMFDLQNQNKKLLESDQENLNKLASVNNNQLFLQNQTTSLNANLKKLKDESALTIKALEDENNKLKHEYNFLLNNNNNYQKNVDKCNLIKAKDAGLNDQIINLNAMIRTLNDQLNDQKAAMNKLIIENKNLVRTKCDLQDQLFNLQTQITFSSSIQEESTKSQLIYIERINDLQNQIKDLINFKNELLAEGNRLLNDHNALKILAEQMMKEGSSLLKEKNSLIDQLGDAKNNLLFYTQKYNTEIDNLKKKLNNLKRSHDHSKDCDSSYESDENSINYFGPINKYPDHNLNNNLGQCPYCPKNGFKNVNVHIGHMHKCKNCRKLTFECKCIKRDIIEPIRRYQTQPAFF